MCSTVLTFYYKLEHSVYSTVLIAQSLLNRTHITVGMAECWSNVVFSFQHNLRCFGVNYDMSRITRFLCYFLSLILASVLSYYAFPSLISCHKNTLFCYKAIFVVNSCTFWRMILYFPKTLNPFRGWVYACILQNSRMAKILFSQFMSLFKSQTMGYFILKQHTVNIIGWQIYGTGITLTILVNCGVSTSDTFFFVLKHWTCQDSLFPNFLG